MATLSDHLSATNAYPIPRLALAEFATRRGVTLEDEATQENLTSPAFRLLQADVYMWLTTAPSISQGGQSYSFTAEQVKDLRNRALGIYNEFAADDGEECANASIFGYKGSRL